MWAGAVAVAIGAFTITMSAHITGAPSGLEPTSAGYPTQSTIYLQQHMRGVRLLGLHQWGGYLVHELYPEDHVFIDGRADVYGSGVVRDYVEIVMTKQNWQALLDQYGVDSVLLPPNAKLSVALRQELGWREVYKHGYEDLFLRR